MYESTLICEKAEIAPKEIRGRVVRYGNSFNTTSTIQQDQ